MKKMKILVINRVCEYIYNELDHMKRKRENDNKIRERDKIHSTQEIRKKGKKRVRGRDQNTGKERVKTMIYFPQKYLHMHHLHTY